MEYLPIIGLEVHVQLNTEEKMFCRCPNDPFGQAPNSLTCPTCLGLPGGLPVPSFEAVEKCLRLGLALGCAVNSESYFERKNYFYPDLPKGYQISQYQKPFCPRGSLEVNGQLIRINRVHLEEDTGKLLHVKGTDGNAGHTLVDFNRSGVPLAEIVSEPDFHDVETVVVYLKELQRLVRYLGVANADMEKGSMRLEPTVNLKINRDNQDVFTPLVEIKNINSFRFVKKALEYEIQRQHETFMTTGEEKKAGNKTTVGFSEAKGATVPQREKEEANDYRYFPEPDIPPLTINPELIANLQKSLPELPAAKRQRFIKDYGLTEYQTEILSDVPEKADYFESLVKAGLESNVAAKFLINKPDNFGRIPEEIIMEIKNRATETITDEVSLGSLVTAVIKENPGIVSQYRAGKKETLGFLIGQAKKKSAGRADARSLRELLEQRLDA